jgi:hypothetical protein
MDLNTLNCSSYVFLNFNLSNGAHIGQDFDFVTYLANLPFDTRKPILFHTAFLSLMQPTLNSAN